VFGSGKLQVKAARVLERRTFAGRLRADLDLIGEIAEDQMRTTQSLQPIRVLVAASSGIESELLAEAIGRDRRFLPVGSAVNSADIHSLANERCPDVLLITPNLDDELSGGLEVLADFRISHPSLKIVVLLESHQPDLVVQSFRLGARGVFSKDLPIRKLGKCINCVQKGQIWASNQELGFLLDALAIARPLRPFRTLNLSELSARELEVVNSLAEGLSNQEIAQRLKLSRHTIKNYIVRIFHKVGASSRFELLFHALRGSASAIKD
jgi:two-component system, NarL family, nitrate/nitrite response regulator NarL